MNPLKLPHVFQRALQRHGLVLSWSDLWDLTEICRTGYNRIGDGYGGVEYHEMHYRTKQFIAVYKPPGPSVQDPRGMIVTLLPKHSAQESDLKTRLILKEKFMTLPWKIQQASATNAQLVARLQCGECSKPGQVPATNIGNNPEKITKVFERLGWEMDQHNARRCICPNCIAVRKLRRKGESPDKPPPVDMTPVSFAKEADMHMAMALKTLDPTMKARLRSILDTCFDDSTGKYLDGRSDQNIADELNIPAITVTNYRDSAYGPIQEDEDVLWIKSELETIHRLQAELQSRIAKWEVKVAECAKKLRL